jgi:tRNA(fMet)-specific endonuclease VapC
MIHLDTNVLIALLNGRTPEIRARFDAETKAGAGFCISVIVYHELMYGAAGSLRRAETELAVTRLISSAMKVLPLTAEDAMEAADIRATLKRFGTPIGPYDVLIAAQARRSASLLVTANGREFERIPRLRVEHWA